MLTSPNVTNSRMKWQRTSMCLLLAQLWLFSAEILPPRPHHSDTYAHTAQLRLKEYHNCPRKQSLFCAIPQRYLLCLNRRRCSAMLSTVSSTYYRIPQHHSHTSHRRPIMRLLGAVGVCVYFERHPRSPHESDPQLSSPVEVREDVFHGPSVPLTQDVRVARGGSNSLGDVRPCHREEPHQTTNGFPVWPVSHRARPPPSGLVVLWGLSVYRRSSARRSASAEFRREYPGQYPTSEAPSHAGTRNLECTILAPLGCR